MNIAAATLKARPLNRKKDTQKPQHIRFSDTVSSVDLRPSSPPIYDQGQFGSCTGNAWVRLIEFLQLKEIFEKLVGMPEEFGIEYTELSRLFFYFDERALHHDTSVDDGAELADGATTVSQKGICPESMWPYDQADLLTPPTKECYQEAAQHKVSKVISIDDGNIQDMKTCLLQGFPFVFGITVYDSFMSDEAAATGIIPMPDVEGETVQGGHALCCVGFDDVREDFIVANSWGTGWGDEGYLYLPYAYMADTTLASDIWTARI